ncbi:amino acid/polyamine/organocation transporter (APC superfamily) [Kocuria sp. AG109]|nr:amino acid/polyamine/organocation transporter (APC superfamily) [Kocuria sp. AG109]
MRTPGSRLRDAVLGAPQETERLRRLSLPRRQAMPVFGADGVSSLAYSPDEVVMVLALAGTAALSLAPWVGLLIAVTLLLVIGTYRYNLREVARSGGDFQVVSDRLGPRAGTAAGVSLLFDFVLTAAVSAAAASSYLVTLLPSLAGHRVGICLVIIAVLTAVRLRGIGLIGRLNPVPAYLFVLLVAVLVAVGLAQDAAGTLGPAPSADYGIQPGRQVESVVTGAGLALLVLRAFSSGAVGLTGVESVSNSARFFRRPRARGASQTLLAMGLVSAVFLVAVLHLVRATGAVVVMDPRQLVIDGATAPADLHQMPLLAQVSRAVFGDGLLGALVPIATVLVLLVAPAAAYSGFPVLASAMARRGYLPVHLNARLNRAVYANAVLLLGVAACLVVLAFGAQVNDLIQLYVLGVLFSMSLTQAAVIRTRHRSIRLVLDRLPRKRLIRDQLVTCVGFAATVLGLLIVLVTKLVQGAWVTVLVVVVGTWLCLRIKSHYERVDEELAVRENNPLKALPSRVHAMVVIPRLRLPALRALAYARASRPSSIEALVLNIDETRTHRIRALWDRYEVPVPLTILAAPFRDPVAPVVRHVRRFLKRSPRDVVVVYIPDYVVEHWWQALLHHRLSRRLVRALRREPGVITAVVPWRLGREDGQDVPDPTQTPRVVDGQAPGEPAASETTQTAEGQR